MAFGDAVDDVDGDVIKKAMKRGPKCLCHTFLFVRVRGPIKSRSQIT